jgi:hypothetical protein
MTTPAILHAFARDLAAANALADALERSLA